MVEKANNYAKYVREMYAPQISEDNVLIRGGKENLRGNSVEDEPEVISIINPRRATNIGVGKKPARRNTAENKYNNVRIHLQDNSSSLGPPPSDS